MYFLYLNITEMIIGLTPIALWAAHRHTALLHYGCPDPAPLSLSHFASCQLWSVQNLAKMPKNESLKIKNKLLLKAKVSCNQQYLSPIEYKWFNLFPSFLPSIHPSLKLLCEIPVQSGIANNDHFKMSWEYFPCTTVWSSRESCFCTSLNIKLH